MGQLELSSTESADLLRHDRDVARAQQPDAGGMNTTDGRPQTVR
jgi:hypothetical protein